MGYLKYVRDDPKLMYKGLESTSVISSVSVNNRLI